jgi:hypothetical protein
MRPLPRPVRTGPALAVHSGLAILLEVLPLCILMLSVVPARAGAQELTLPEYRELLLSKESVLLRLERELAAANRDLERLVRQRDNASRRGQRTRGLTDEIVKVSNRIGELERQRRTAQADLRALRAVLHERYTSLIDANLERLDEMEQQDPRYSELLVETGRAITARDALRMQIRIQESIPNFREFPILATDGPAEIREKAGFYRDYVRDVERRIGEIDAEMSEIRQLASVQTRMREFREDLAFQGEDAPTRAGDAPGGGDIREEPAPTNNPEGDEPLNRSPTRRIAELEEIRRQLVLLRRGFEIRVRDYEERARTIYSQQGSQSGEELR